MNMKNDKHFGAYERKTAGFTMIEALGAIAILVILMGLGFIAVQNHQRSMKQLELDKTAQEIFVAAQNHLTLAQSQGLLADVDTSDSEKVGESFTNPSRYYWFVAPGNEPRPGSVLNDMLPYGAIDDATRSGKSYVIEYDFDTATVLNVFYSDQSKNLSEYQFSDSDYTKLFSGSGAKGGFEGEGNKAKRLEGYEGKGVLGWYGGATANPLSQETLHAPRIKITNAERLTVTVMFDLSDVTHDASVSDTVVKVFMQGETSGKTEVIGSKDVSSLVGLSPLAITYILDDITKNEFTENIEIDDGIVQNWSTGNRHFANQWSSLTPGENITIYAEVSTNSAFARPARSARRHANSLFDSIVYASGVKEMQISNIRHLENLDSSVGGYTTAGLTSVGVIDSGKMGAKQVADLQWSGTATPSSMRVFCDRVADDVCDPGEIQVHDAAGGSTGIVGAFYPITPLAGVGLTYDGGKHRIIQAQFNDATSAGLFKTVHDGTAIKDLELLDCSAESSNNDGFAGILLGEAEADSLTFENVLVHDTSGSTMNKADSQGTSGGLIGRLGGGTSSAPNILNGCAASIIVQATETAGGLVGSISADSYAQIKHCYAGGHVDDSSHQYNDSSANVVAEETAGGLIGQSTGDTSITYSYSTCSVSANTTAGGLVGSMTNGSVEDCYSTGLVLDGVMKGAFAGSLTGTRLEGNNHYYEIINYGMDVVGSSSSGDTTLVPLDKDEETYDDFCKLAGEAVPYDSYLKDIYQGKYTFSTVAELAGTGMTDYYVNSHYGDWPSPETFVLNERSGGTS